MISLTRLLSNPWENDVCFGVCTANIAGAQKRRPLNSQVELQDQ